MHGPGSVCTDIYVSTRSAVPCIRTYTRTYARTYVRTYVLLSSLEHAAGVRAPRQCWVGPAQVGRERGARDRGGTLRAHVRTCLAMCWAAGAAAEEAEAQAPQQGCACPACRGANPPSLRFLGCYIGVIPYVVSLIHSPCKFLFTKWCKSVQIEIFSKPFPISCAAKSGLTNLSLRSQVPSSKFQVFNNRISTTYT